MMNFPNCEPGLNGMAVGRMFNLDSMRKNWARGHQQKKRRNDACFFEYLQ